jgi:predicted nucleic acid-binding protein
VVDAGPLYAVADADDRDHRACMDTLAREDLRLVVPAPAIAEATYFVGRRLGARAESAFLRGIAELDIEAPSPEDLLRMAHSHVVYLRRTAACVPIRQGPRSRQQRYKRGRCSRPVSIRQEMTR